MLLRRGWLAHALVIAAYALLAVVLTWPLAAHFGTHVPGNGVDDPALTWNLWWVRHALLTLKTNPLDCNLIFYPLGINLAFYTHTLLNGLLVVPLDAAVGLIPASNLLLLASFVLGGYGTFLLVRTLARRHAALRASARSDARAVEQRPDLASLLAAFVAGLIYAFAANKLFYAALGQWDIVSSQWIPFYALCLVKIEAEPGRWRHAILAGLFLVFQAYAEAIFASFLVLLTVLWAAWPRGWRRMLGLVRPLLIIIALFVLGLAPLLAAMIPEMLAEGEVLTEGGGFADVFSADLLGFLVPTMHHPLLGALVDEFHFDHTVGQHVYVGYGVLALAVLGAVWGWKRRAAGREGAYPLLPQQPAAGGYGVRFWAVAALLFWLLTLGPELRINGQPSGLPLPFALVSRLPLFEGNRYPSRYSVMLLLCVAVLAGWGLAALTSWLGRRRPTAVRRTIAGLAPLLLAPLLLFEHLSIPLPLSDMRVPPVYAAIAGSPAEGETLLEVPVGWRNGARVTGAQDPVIMFEEYYQTAHGKRLLGGNTSRNPPFKFQYFTEAPIINTLLAFETGHAVSPATIEADHELAPAVLRFFDIGTVVVHPGHVGSEMVSYIETALPVRQLEGVEDPTALAYTTALPSWPAGWQVRPDDPVGRLSYAEGWGAPGGATAWAQRRTVRLLVPADGQDQHLWFRALAPGDGQQLRITVNGTTAGKVAMRAGWQDYDLDLLSALRVGLNEVDLHFDQLYPAEAVRLAARTIGGTGIESPVNLVVESAGQEVGDFAHIYVNGRDVAPNQRGYNVAVLHPQTGAVEQTAAFDTHLDEGASQALAAFLDAIPAGRVVAVAAADEASRLLGPEAVAALQRIGAAGDGRDKFRWSHALIGVKGAVPGTALEALAETRPVRVAAGESITEPQVAAGFSELRFGAIQP